MSVFPTIKDATPINDISGLKLNIATKEQLDQAEAQNIAKVVLKYLTRKPSKRSALFDMQWILRLHQQMFDDVWEWAGVIRNTPPPNIGVQAYQIREELGKLIGDLHYWENLSMDLDEQAVRLHHRAVLIHPFANGNGRWSRMLGDIWLKRHGRKFPTWPSGINQEESPVRVEYIQAVKKADNGNFDDLLELHKRFIPAE